VTTKVTRVVFDSTVGEWDLVVTRNPSRDPFAVTMDLDPDPDDFSEDFKQALKDWADGKQK